MRASRWLVVALVSVASLAIGFRGALPSAKAVKNGREVSTAQYPFMVGLSHNPLPIGFPGDAKERLEGPNVPPAGWRDSRSGVSCGGTLVAERFVVTAAHCVSEDRKARVIPNDMSLRPLWVIAGRDDLGAWAGTEVRVKDIWVHPEYLSDRREDADLAVLSLSHGLPGSLPLAPAQDTGIDAAGKQAMLLGYGRTNPGADLSQKLLGAQMPIRPITDCGWTEGNFVCAGGIQAHEGQNCKGDSGGPLVVDGQLVAVSHSLMDASLGCGTPDRPGVFASVRGNLSVLERGIAELRSRSGEAAQAWDPASGAGSVREYSCATGEKPGLVKKVLVGDSVATGTIRVKFGQPELSDEGTVFPVEIFYKLDAPFLVGGFHPFRRSRADVWFHDTRGESKTVRFKTDEGKQNNKFHKLGEYRRLLDAGPVNFRFVFDTPNGPDTFRCSVKLSGLYPAGLFFGSKRVLEYACGDPRGKEIPPWGNMYARTAGHVLVEMNRKSVTRIGYEINLDHDKFGEHGTLRIYDDASDETPFISSDPTFQNGFDHWFPDSGADRLRRQPWRFFFDFGSSGKCVGMMPAVP